MTPQAFVTACNGHFQKIRSGLSMLCCKKRTMFLKRIAPSRKIR
jgi:hypothetical protein